MNANDAKTQGLPESHCNITEWFENGTHIPCGLPKFHEGDCMRKDIMEAAAEFGRIQKARERKERPMELPEMIAERLGDEGYLAMMKEPVAALIRKALLGSELVKAAQLYLDLHNSGKPGIADYNRLRAALNELKEGKNG